MNSYKTINKWRRCDEKRESFNTRWGFILACIGSAVGMGNIWMFPTRVSLYGGGAFLIPYFIFVALIGFTGVIGEMTFGRATRSGPIDAFGIACERKGKRKPGEALGLIPVVGSLAMAIGYTVVMGWILKYTVGAFTGATLAPADVDEFSAAFGSMASAFGNTGWQVVILLAAMGILMFGVGGGIEKVNKVLMPVFSCCLWDLVSMWHFSRGPWTDITISSVWTARRLAIRKRGFLLWDRHFSPFRWRETEH